MEHAIDYPHHSFMASCGHCAKFVVIEDKRPFGVTAQPTVGQPVSGQSMCALQVSVKKRSFGRPIPASSRPRLTRSNNSHHEANDMTDVQSGLDALITSVEMTVAESKFSLTLVTVFGLVVFVKSLVLCQGCCLWVCYARTLIDDCLCAP